MIPNPGPCRRCGKPCRFRIGPNRQKSGWGPCCWDRKFRKGECMYGAGSNGPRAVRPGEDTEAELDALIESRRATMPGGHLRDDERGGVEPKKNCQIKQERQEKE